MRVVVIGSSGRTGGKVVTRLLAQGHEVCAVVRRAEQVPDLVAAGASVAVVDLLSATRSDLRRVVGGAAAVVYTAGSGYGAAGAVVDRVDGGAITDAVDAAQAEGVDRFVLVSAHRTDEDFGPPSVVRLLRAKRAADAHLRASSLGWTIIRPDALTEEAGSGMVQLGERVPQGALARDDLVALIAAVLADPACVRTQFEVVGGRVPVGVALQGLCPAL